jgi:hypothetical protein
VDLERGMSQALFGVMHGCRPGPISNQSYELADFGRCVETWLLSSKYHSSLWTLQPWLYGKYHYEECCGCCGWSPSLLADSLL